MVFFAVVVPFRSCVVYSLVWEEIMNVWFGVYVSQNYRTWNAHMCVCMANVATVLVYVIG